MTLEKLKELLYRHGNAAISRQKYLDTAQTFSRQYHYDRKLYDIETEILDSDAALRATIQQQAERIERLKKQLAERDATIARMIQERDGWKDIIVVERRGRLGAEQREQRLRETLEMLRDHQNGCPLPSYEYGWTKAMELTEAALAEQESSPSPQGEGAPHRER